MMNYICIPQPFGYCRAFCASKMLTHFKHDFSRLLIIRFEQTNLEQLEHVAVNYLFSKNPHYRELINRKKYIFFKIFVNN